MALHWFGQPSFKYSKSCFRYSRLLDIDHFPLLFNMDTNKLNTHSSLSNETMNNEYTHINYQKQKTIHKCDKGEMHSFHSSTSKINLLLSNGYISNASHKRITVDKVIQNRSVRRWQTTKIEWWGRWCSLLSLDPSSS